MKLSKYVLYSLTVMVTTVLISQPAQASTTRWARTFFKIFLINHGWSGLLTLLFWGVIIMVPLGILGAIVQGIFYLFSK